MNTMMGQSRILIVDDEPKLVRLVKEILLATGYVVMITGTGQQAIEAVAIEQPDLVLLDIMLPGGMDGYEVARRLREFSDVPIIMLTAKIRETDMLRGFDVRRGRLHQEAFQLEGAIGTPAGGAKPVFCQGNCWCRDRGSVRQLANRSAAP